MSKSLSLRLLLIFIVALIILLGILMFGFERSISSKTYSLQAGSLAKITRLILDRKTQQININRAKNIAERTGTRIHVRTPGSSWSSAGNIPDENRFQFEELQLIPLRFKKKKHFVPPEITFAKGFKFNIYKITTPHGEIFYEVDNPRVQFEWYWFFIAGLFIFGLYLAIRYLFSPVADIQRVVQEVRHGNFSARTNTHRKDELGELAKQVDTMAEDIDRLIESKRSLLLSISHELRTPLTRATIVSKLMQNSKHTQSLAEDLSEMETIIAELIEAEKLSQESPLARQVVDINALLNEILLQSFADNDIKVIPLSLETSFVNIDPIRIKLLVKNLLKNAIQYTADDQPAPKISLTLAEKYLTITVTDQGIGMPEELVDRLTEPFYRLDQSRQRQTGGFGLGLYLCQAIAKAHRGTLEITSKEGQGTIVSANIALSD